ncbi:MAG TPA: hypothetical protein VIK62_09195 [Verrucomicrobiae bacterium]
MPALLTFWVWLCAYLNVAGWLLSAINELNAFGYGVITIIFALGVGIFRRRLNAPLDWKHWLHKCRRRFTRIFPLIFLVVAALVFLGGILYAPNNYDALTYRLPRVLNWLAVGHWFWIPTINDRMNYSGPAWEWLAAPQLAIFHSDRGLFPINAIGFLLLPGLLFSVFRQVGVARKTAWLWMWLLPLAYGYVTQAGGLGNDITGTIFCLASVHFGLRARKSGRVQDVWLAGLAAALMTAVKLSNLPLALPCLVAVWPSLPLLKGSLVRNFAVAAVTVMVSALPIMGLNYLYAGSWSGDPQNLSQVQVKSAPGALFGNSLQLVQQSFLPPVLPQAHEVYRRFNEALPVSWQEFLRQQFPRYYLGGFSELPSEENAGLGFGISVTLVFLIVTVLLRPQRGSALWKNQSANLGLAVGLAAWISFSVYMLKMGSEATARLLLPYYPLLLILILKLPLQNFLLNSRAWKTWLVLVALSVFPALIFSPARPLWPALTVSQFLLEHHPESRLAQRLNSVYAGYSVRNDPLKSLREAVPASVRKIGFVAGSNDTEYSLWRPFGARIVVCLRTNRTQPGLIIPDDIEWIVVRQAVWNEASALPLNEWCEQHHARIVLSAAIVTIIGRGSETWSLLHLDHATAKAGGS